MEWEYWLLWWCKARGLPKFWPTVNNLKKKVKMQRTYWKGKLLVLRVHQLHMKEKFKREKNAQIKTLRAPEYAVVHEAISGPSWRNLSNACYTFALINYMVLFCVLKTRNPFLWQKGKKWEKGGLPHWALPVVHILNYKAQECQVCSKESPLAWPRG